MRCAWLVCSVLAVLGAAPFVAAQSDAVSVTIEAAEVAGCDVATGSTYCFTVTEGSLDDLAAGTVVELTLVNAGQFPHNVFVTTGANADANHVATSGDDAFANTETVGGGESSSVTFTVPSGAASIYLWCDVGDHEQRGMWLEFDVAPGTAEPDANATDGNTTAPPEMEDDGEDTPLPFALVVVALAVAAVRRRR